MILILLGAPGAGKGTQAKMISRTYGLKHISTGDLLRAAVAEGTELGKLANGYMSAGKLVPDNVMLGIISDYFAANPNTGTLFDGFPRTTEQAEGLDRLIPQGMPVVAISLEVEDELVIKRLSARVTCRSCGQVYNPTLGVFPKGDRCECGGEIYQRADDKAETIANRLKVYHSQTEPIIGFYRNKGVIHQIDGSGSPEDVFVRVNGILG